MISIALVAVTLSAAPASVPPSLFAPLVLEAAKKKKKTKEKEKEKEAPAETSPGIDLSNPEPAKTESTPEPAPAAEEAEPEKKKEEEGQKPAWSLVTPHTVGPSANVLEAEVGWPGLHVGYWRGLLDALDVGAKVGFNWSYEGLVTRPVFGLTFQAQARYMLFDNGSLSLGLSFSPGVIVYFLPGITRPGLALPIAATVGLPLHFVDKLSLSATLDIPLFVIFGVGASIPFVAGVNGEYALNDSLLVFLKLRPLGVAIWTNGAGAFYVFEALAGVGYHL